MYDIKISSLTQSFNFCYKMFQNSWLAFSNMTQKPTLQSSNETNVKIEELKASVSQLANDLFAINQNFTTRIQWVLDDQKKNHVRF